jgi:thiol-disulfide isomerase/thioredoxin
LQEADVEESTGRLIQRVAVLAMLAIVAFTGYRVLHAGEGVQPYAVGDTAKQYLTGKRTTVIMFGRSTCSACQASIPLGKQLHDAVAQRKDAHMFLVDVIGTGPEELKFGAAMGLRSQDVYRNPKPDPKITAVPTYLVLDVDAKVLFVSGVLLPETVEKIKQILSR